MRGDSGRIPRRVHLPVQRSAQGMPLGIAYGLWGATGVALTAIASAVIFNEALTGTMLAGIALIIAGVLTVELGSQRAAT